MRRLLWNARYLLVISVIILQSCASCDEETGTTDNGPANNGTTNNGTANNGTANNGTTNNGTTNNGTANNGTANNGTTNNGTTNNCTAEAAEDFCARLGKDCGMVTAEDSCGDMVTHACGDCTDPETCGGGGENNVCGCEPLSTAQICQNAMKDCGEFMASDGCGNDVTVDCGTCAGDEICGATTANVCECPCNIDNTCVPSGMANPDNPCEVCDPSRATDAWSPMAEGSACDDGLACTTGTTCNADGQCEPADLAMNTCFIDGACYNAGTSDPQNDCRSCDPANDTTDWSDVGQGATCDDGLACTSDEVCDGNGECRASAFTAGTCAISNTCYNQGDLNPNNPCEVCDPAQDQTDWSDAAAGLACDDGLACTSNTVCDGGGDCVGIVATDMCAVDGTCYNANDPNPNDPCERCEPANTQHGWSDSPTGTACDDGLSCTSNDTCDGGDCIGVLSATECLIDGTCYADGERATTQPCSFCDPANDRRDWSFEPAGTVCDDGLSCTGDGTCDGDDECLMGPLMAGTCAIGNACFNAGDVNPANPCEVCQPALDLTDWSPNTGVACDDGLTCTSGDTCDANGQCMGAVDADTCAVDGACYNLGDLNPANDCEVCNSNLSATQWSNVSQGATCDDGLSCTTGETCDFGTCTGGNLAAATCAIANACWNDGDVNPNNPCEICDSGANPRDWSSNDGAFCQDGDGLTCTGVCNGDQCQDDIRGGSCVIDNACYADGDLNPMADCQICDPADDNQDWSVAPDLTACGIGGADVCCQGVCTAGNSCP